MAVVSKVQVLVLVLGVLMAPLGWAQKAPGMEDARRLVRSMDRVFAETMIWNKKPLEARTQAVDEASKLVADMDRSPAAGPLGEPSRCRTAARAMKAYVLGLNDMVLISEGRKPVGTPTDLLTLVYQGAQFGDAYRACQDEIELLDRPASKKRKS